MLCAILESVIVLPSPSKRTYMRTEDRIVNDIICIIKILKRKQYEICIDIITVFIAYNIFNHKVT